MKLDLETDFYASDVEESIESPTDTTANSQKLAAGITAAKNGDFTKARILLLQVSEAEPENEDAWLWLASISQFPDELLIFLNNVLHVNPANKRALQWAAATKSVLSKSLVQRGIEASKESQNNFAKQCFLQAIIHENENELAWLWLASVSSEIEEKNAYLEKVLLLNPENETALISSATIKKQMAQTRMTRAIAEAGDGEQAATLAALDEIIAKAPETADALLLKSFFAPSLDEKIECLEKILRFDPNNDLARGNRAFLQALKAKLFDQEQGESELEDDEQFNEKFELFDVPESNVLPGAAEVFGCVEPGEFSAAEENLPSYYETEISPEPVIEIINCPFCAAEIEARAIACQTCGAMLSLSDLETLLAYQNGNIEAVKQAVEEMEMKKSVCRPDAGELKILGIGEINLKHFRQGFAYLQEAVRENPIDVVLSSQVNALAVRLAEIEAQNAARDSALKNKKILIVDDSATVRKLIADKLEKSGHAVSCAVGGADALEQIKRSLPDLILLDISMPEMDGYQVCKSIRVDEKTKDIPVIMISGKDGFFDKVRGRMAGATGYITKPFGPETLIKTIESYMVRD